MNLLKTIIRSATLNLTDLMKKKLLKTIQETNIDFIMQIISFFSINQNQKKIKKNLMFFYELI